jgi:hypothetical protein
MEFQSSKFDGMSENQVLAILNELASTMNTAVQLCRSANVYPEEYDAGDTFCALERMLCGAGALADSASTFKMIGDLASWMYGSGFHEMAEPERPKPQLGGKIHLVAQSPSL